MAIQFIYKDLNRFILSNGSILLFSEVEYNLSVKYAESHSFEIIVVTSKDDYIQYNLMCSVCKITGYKFNNDKLVVCGNHPLNLTCSENIIKDIIE